jgi:hypothetical protein
MAGRPKVLDDNKRSTICSLVASGVSLRQIAAHIGCAPRSIRRDIQRNGQFRANLAKARAEARMHPLKTLRKAAATNWRAALVWMERLEPGRFADPTEALVTKREANRFVDDLVASIEEAVTNPRQRHDLLDLLGPAMPPAMRRRWESEAMGRAMEQVKEDVEERNRLRFVRALDLKAERDRRREKVFDELKEYLPQAIQSKLWDQRDLLDPEEVFAERPAAGAGADTARAS